MNCAVHPKAEAEFLAALYRYREIDPRLAHRFYGEISAALRRITRYPLRYKQFNPPARRLTARGFPYAVIYVARPESVWIIAIVHFRRKPGYWKGRLKP